jgi:hypothetical protein
MRAGTEVALLLAFVAAECLGACTGYESEYERGVYNYEPLYCYQTLGGVDCHRKPHRRDSTRLVNYYGPAPGKYDPPDPPEESPLQPPPDVKKAVYRDPEPAVGPASAAAATREAEGRDSASAGKDEAGGKGGRRGEEIRVEGVAAAHLCRVRRFAGRRSFRPLKIAP